MITKEIFALPDSALHEWITTNYNGSYSSSTLSFANTRSYHGIFCVRDSKTYDSWVLVNKVFEELVVNGESFSTDTNIYNGAVHPDGYRYLRDYTLLPYPVFTYSFGRLTVRKKFLLHPYKDLVVVRYEFPSIVPDEIRIFPLVSIRNFHSLIRSDSGNIRTTFSDGRLEVAARGMTFYFWGDFYLEPRGIWYYNFVYPEEMKRGISFSEDLYSCCTGLGKGGNVADLFISTGYETLKTDELEKMIEDSFNAPQVNGSPAACASKISRLLLLKDDIIAGYHWFGPWTRDTMISMPGILLTAGKYDHALAILSKYRDLSRNGLLPKNLGDVQDYGAADASLWFIYAIFKYYEYTGDR
ncbi:MAG TPA: glycogen debranching enzyme N-terminal domain-containing protein, partial [Thermoplasmataceae archaeon]|nr:glycogen debranching enzyme N-terminal domain-containing protein [Thermoplasmataceae archaeon]